MKRLLVPFLILSSVNLYSQTVQWASSVIDFSTELTSVQYGAKQALGKPNVLPAGGESPNAWTPDRSNTMEFLKLGFENPIKIKQIAIAESYNPSAITALYLYDEEGKENKVTDLRAREITIESRMLNIFFETDYKVAAVRLTFDGSKVPEYYSIDAVAISDSDIQILAEPEIAEALTEGVVIDRLSEKVNSEYKEYKPILSPDGNTLYFSRKYHPENLGGVEDPEDIWYSEKDENGEWKEAQNAGAALNNAGPNFVSSITPDGNTAIMLLGNKYLGGDDMEAGVSISSNETGNWSNPIPLLIENEYNLSDKANFFLANSRKVLILSVEREDTEGDRDLYVSFNQGDSIWSEPLNLGSVVNTASEESSPFLAADDKTLYFASDGFSGYGGTDIYVTKRLDDTWLNWSEPQNMGPEINSAEEDLFFNVPTSSNFAYYSRGVNSEDTDIFQVELPIFQRPDPTVTVSGILADSKSGEPVPAKISYFRKSDDKELGVTYNDPKTGIYELVLPIGEVYELKIDAEGYYSDSEIIDLTDYEGDEDMKLDSENFNLVPIEKEITIVLNEVYFEFDKAILKPESFVELNKLVSSLKENPSVKIEIAGHTDTSGPESYNLLLSERRAEAVANYLVDKEINRERLTTVWFGETKPEYTNETREGRKKNRRVEFKVTEK